MPNNNANTNSRGFLTYFMIFLLLIVATFLVIVTFMMMSPFSNVLGFKYVYYSREKAYTRVTDSYDVNPEVDGSTYAKIFLGTTDMYINGDNVYVKVLRSNKVSEPYLKYNCNIMGFARNGQETDAIYSCKKDSGIVTVTVEKPSTFLNFKQDVGISILIPSEASYDEYLNNFTIHVTNKSGDVYLGNSTKLPAGNSEIKISGVDFKSNSGSLIINKFFNPTIKKVFFNSDSGAINTAIETLTVSESLEVYSSKGRINFNKLISNGNTILSLANAKFKVAEITANNVEFSIKDGYFDVDTINGNLISNNSLNDFGYAQLNIKKVAGDVSLPFAGNAKIKINEISGQTFISGKGCSLNLSNINAAYIETTSGNVNITKQNDLVLTVKTVSGNIKVNYNISSVYDNRINLESQKGNIKFNIKPSASCKFVMKNTKGEYKTKKSVDNKILSGSFANPFEFNFGSNQINLTTDGNIVLDLIK